MSTLETIKTLDILGVNQMIARGEAALAAHKPEIDEDYMRELLAALYARRTELEQAARIRRQDRRRNRWGYLGRAARDAHKYFRELSTGKIGIADLSGLYPEETDDGVLYVDFTREMTGPGRYGYSLPLTRASGELCSTLVSPEERMWLIHQDWWPGAKPYFDLTETER
jgi:hypothetical protein